MGQLSVFSLICALLILTGVDLRISFERWKQGVPDLNPVVQHFVSQTPLAGALALVSINLLVIAAASMYTPLLWMLTGGKLSLAAIQIRSKVNEYRNVS